MDKKSGMSGFHGKRVLFIRTLGLLIALSLLTVVIFGVFINQLVVKNQKDKIDELNLNQLQRISSDVELIFDLLAQGMTRSMWSDDFIELMITPDQHNADLAHRIIRVLDDQVNENDLVRKSYLYLPFSDEVYVYSGTYMELEYLGDREMIHDYLRMREENRDPEANSEWRGFLYNRRIFLAADFCLPNFVGAMFYEINRQELYNIIQAENENFNTTIYVYDKEGLLLFDYMAGGLQPDDFSRPDLFLTSTNNNGRGSYYMTTSSRLGWRYLVRVNPEESSVSVGQMISILLPCVVFYILASMLFSLYITRSVYSPINRLLKITTDPKNGTASRKKIHRLTTEADFLELAWQDSLDKHEQHQALMANISDELQEQTFRGILTGKDPEKAEETLRNIGREDLLTGYFVALAVEVFYKDSEKSTMVEQELYQRSLLQILPGQEREDMALVALPMSMTRVAVILRFAPNQSAFQIRERIAQVENAVQESVKSLPYEVKVGRGNTCTELTAIPYSWHEAVEKIRYQRYQEEAETAGEMSQSASQSEEFYYVKMAQHGYQLAENGQCQEAEKEMQSLIREICRREKDAVVCFNRLIDDMMEKLISCRISQAEINEVGVQQCIETYRQMRDMNGRQKQMEVFYQLTLSLVWESSRKSNNHYVQKAKEYIIAHYEEGTLTLAEISDALGISNSYLSSIFTEGTGTGINAWLNEYRIRQAKRFLDETSLNISEIGYKCGFNSAQSFTRVFKKLTGVSPKQYRETPNNAKQGGGPV